MFGGLSFQSFWLGSAIREPPSCRANYVKLFLFIFCSAAPNARSFYVLSRYKSCKTEGFISDMECVERRKTISGDINLFSPVNHKQYCSTVTNGKMREFNMET